MSKSDVVKLWEDTVGGSGEAPTDEELWEFPLAVDKQALSRLSDHFRVESLMFDPEDDPEITPNLPHYLHWASRRVEIYTKGLLG